MVDPIEQIHPREDPIHRGSWQTDFNVRQIWSGDDGPPAAEHGRGWRRGC
jgi:hypothetical protein